MNILKLRFIIIGIIIGAIVLSALAWLIPAPPSNYLPLPAYHMAIVSNALFGLLYIGTAVLFVLGLQGFKKEIHDAYKAICTGLVVLAVAHLQVPVIQITSQFNNPWYTYGGSKLLYLLAALFLWSGVSKFAVVLGIKSRWVSKRFLVTFLAGVGVLMLAVAPAAPYQTLTQDMMVVVMQGWLSATLIAAAVVAFKLKQTASAVYTSALRWFFLAVCVQVVSATLPTVADFFGVEKGPYLSVPAIALNGFFLASGYAFNKINLYFGADQPVKAKDRLASPIDVITYVASLASNPKSIDPMLDALRGLTANLKPNQALSDDDQKMLATTYRQLESYLTAHEPVRVFTTEMLTATVQKKFAPGRSTYKVFWSKALVLK